MRRFVQILHKMAHGIFSKKFRLSLCKSDNAPLFSKSVCDLILLHYVPVCTGLLPPCCFVEGVIAGFALGCFQPQGRRWSAEANPPAFAPCRSCPWWVFVCGACCENLTEVTVRLVGCPFLGSPRTAGQFMNQLCKSCTPVGSIVNE